MVGTAVNQKGEERTSTRYSLHEEVGGNAFYTAPPQWLYGWIVG
jgi:hypothetical protein